MRYAYYPGCSLHASGIAYDKSLRAVFARLGQELVEIEDWNCCGATAYMSIGETVAFAISARNLALAERAGGDVVAPCSACFAVLSKTKKFLREVPQLRAEVDAALAEAGLSCQYRVPVRHPLEVLLTDIGTERLLGAQTHSLAAFRPACYYGCQIVRPERAFPGDPEAPTLMEGLLAALGAEPVDYPPKVRCCGGMLAATAEEVAEKLCLELLGWAQERGANCLVTVCPLCQANLELLGRRAARHGGPRPALPVLYFTQLVGLALGSTPRELGFDHSLIPVGVAATPLLSPGRETLGRSAEA
jgi:heterodisulfide reductase subunit B